MSTEEKPKTSGVSKETVRRTLYAIYYTAITLAAAAMVLGLFMLGHTETFSPPAILLTGLLSGACAIVAGVLQWVGLPAKEDDGQKKKR